MRYLRVLLLLAGALSSGACFQFSTVLTVNPDGTGTIQQHLLFTQAALAQLRQFAAFGGGGPQNFDPLSEQQARDAAVTLGQGVTYVSSTPINSPEGQGRDIRYAFTDISQLRIVEAPPAPGGLSINAPNLGTDAQVAFKLTHESDGRSVLKITMPQFPLAPGAGGAGPQGIGNLPSPEQMALVRPMFAGAKLAVFVEPAGTVVRTNSQFVDGRRVTLMDVNVDSLLNDDALMRRLQSAKSADEGREMLKGVPGLKINLDPEITIEFR